MGEEINKTPVTINDVEYFLEDMSDEQKLMINHVRDLDRKISNMQFNLDQLNVGRKAFVDMLSASLAE